MERSCLVRRSRPSRGPLLVTGHARSNALKMSGLGRPRVVACIYEPLGAHRHCLFRFIWRGLRERERCRLSWTLCFRGTIICLWTFQLCEVTQISLAQRIFHQKVNILLYSLPQVITVWLFSVKTNVMSTQMRLGNGCVFCFSSKDVVWWFFSVGWCQFLFNFII